MAFNRRRMMRSQRKIMFCAIVVFIVFMVYVIMFTEDHKILEKHFNPLSERCLSTAAEDLLKELCSNYSKGIAFGSFCNKLCDGHSIKVDSCIRHGTTYVLFGTHKGKDIVIKKKKPHSLKITFEIFEEAIFGRKDLEHIQNAYLNRLTDEIRSTLGADSASVFTENKREVILSLFGKQLQEMNLEEMRNSWYLVGQDELIVTTLHQKLKSMPTLQGTCGPVYVVEGTKPFSQLFPQITSTISVNWTVRATLAKNFLKLLRDFQNSDVGQLHHCDIQEANFGITNNFEVKAIDVDLIYSPNRMKEILPQPSCSKDGDCDFFDCVSRCHIETKKCTTNQITNNLMVLCRDIFFPSWPISGLLSKYQPSHVAKQLTTLLNDCKSPPLGMYSMDHHNVQSVMKDLEILLDRSLQPP